MEDHDIQVQFSPPAQFNNSVSGYTAEMVQYGVFITHFIEKSSCREFKE